MATIIRLTSTHDDNHFIYVNIDHILYFKSKNNVTHIVLSGGPGDSDVYVRESADELLKLIDNPKQRPNRMGGNFGKAMRGDL